MGSASNIGFAVTLLAVSLFTLTGCSKSTPPSDGYVAAKAITDPPPPPEKHLKQPDHGTPLSQYRKVDNDEQMMALYYALAGLPIDYDAAAQVISRDYLQQQDAFKRREMMAVLKPRIDAEVAAARDNPYIELNLDSMGLGHYDFDKKGFSTTNFTMAGNYYTFNGSYELSFSNLEDYKLLKVTDENVAKTIEASGQGGSISVNPTFYAFAQDVDLRRHRVLAVIVQISIADRQGRPLFTTE